MEWQNESRVCHGQLRALIILIQDAGDLSVYCATSGANGRGDVFVNNRPTSAASPARRHWAELIKQVEKIARAAGASRIYWLTKEDNVSARALYDKLADRSGFIQYYKLF